LVIVLAIMLAKLVEMRCTIIIVIARVGRSDLKFQAHFPGLIEGYGTKLSRRNLRDAEGSCKDLATQVHGACTTSKWKWKLSIKSTRCISHAPWPQ
jgi:hypothetical protein